MAFFHELGRKDACIIITKPHLKSALCTAVLSLDKQLLETTFTRYKSGRRRVKRAAAAALGARRGPRGTPSGEADRPSEGGRDTGGRDLLPLSSKALQLLFFHFHKG